MKITLKDCSGCHNNFYNQNNMGLNMETGRPRCWLFATAILVKARDIPTSWRPPYNNLPETNRPNCYKAKGYVRVKKESLTKDGFWKS